MTSTEQEAAAERLRVTLATVTCSRRRSGQSWRGKRLGLELRLGRACARVRNRWLRAWRTYWGFAGGLEGSEEDEFGDRRELVGV
jgi:hypothetical protein